MNQRLTDWELTSLLEFASNAMADCSLGNCWIQCGTLSSHFPDTGELIVYLLLTSICTAEQSIIYTAKNVLYISNVC